MGKNLRVSQSIFRSLSSFDLMKMWASLCLFYNWRNRIPEPNVGCPALVPGLLVLGLVVGQRPSPSLISVAMSQVPASESVFAGIQFRFFWVSEFYTIVFLVVRNNDLFFRDSMTSKWSHCFRFCFHWVFSLCEPSGNQCRLCDGKSSWVPGDNLPHRREAPLLPS